MLLPVLTVLTYLLSYIYLAVYHGRVNILNVVVHESGEYTLLQTIFYASHFLGHIPVYTMVAFLFVGACRSLVLDANAVSCPQQHVAAGVSLLLLLAVSLAISLVHFGWEDTVSFMLQRKQTPHLYVRGGSWNLHFASSSLLFVWVPLYVGVAASVLGRKVQWYGRGYGYFATGLLMLFGFTFLANGAGWVRAMAVAWTQPRYLAHSVREIATFSLTYFPVPLCYLLYRGAQERPARDLRHNRKTILILCLLGGVFVGGFAYQSAMSLMAGIGDIAQKPDFAKAGKLSVRYLLCSHFFEHVLDTVYFGLLVVWLCGCQREESRQTHEST